MTDSIEAFIREGEIQIEGRLVDASNATLLGKVRDDISVIYKPVAGERPLWDFPTGNLASREVAAYELSRLGGFGLVPFTVLRNGPYGIGAVQQWIDVDENIDVVSYAQSQDTQLRKMALFDAVINNTDRKYGHILLDENGKLFGCDHGVTFHEDDKLRTVLWQFAGSPFTPDEMTQIQYLLKELPAWELHHYLSVTELAALNLRLQMLADTATFPFPSEDWPAIPWPPF
ncbi:MAG: SCO1664 family protein [Actinomycetes bacterium]